MPCKSPTGVAGATPHYAGCDVFHGVNPDFADLRSAGAGVFQLSKLSVDPFEEGSFLIPARLEAEEIEAPGIGSRRKMSKTRPAGTYREIQDMGHQYLDELTLRELIRWIDSLDRI